MSGNFVRDEAVFYVLLVRQTEVLFGGDVAEHGRAIPSDHCRTNGGGNVIIARCNVCGERSQGIEGGFVTPLHLFIDIFFDEVHRDVPGAFVHDLNIVFPGDFGEFALRLQFGKLRFIIGIGNGARAQPVAERE